jgi:hypothetical protein
MLRMIEACDRTVRRVPDLQVTKLLEMAERV